MTIHNIAIYATEENLNGQAKQLAERLNLPITKNKNEYDYQLIITPDYLGLQKTGTKLGPLIIDFLSGRLAYRRKHASLRHETLARAMGLKNKTTPKIIDATGGLGRDSFILACLGFEVQLLERSPIIHALLEEGINRALQDPVIAPIAQRLHLIHADAVTWLQQLNADQRPDIIYLDPMYPDRSKSALAKKDMQIFHDIVGNDSDSELLFTTALTCASQRIVLKRPRLAGYLTTLAPSFSHMGSSSRFDIYLK